MRLAGLESLRGAAAAYVLFHHVAALQGWGGALGLAARFGQEAVIVFFLLSGFVIALAQERAGAPGFGDYLRRRATRIFPTFLLALAVAALFAPSLARPDVRTDLTTLLGNLVQLQDLSALKPGVWIEVFGGNDPLWSLSYEWWFYLMFFGLWRWRADRVRDRDVALAGGAAVIVYALAPNPIALIVAYFPIWWAGARLAHMHLSGVLRWSGFAPLALVAVFWSVVAAVHMARNGPVSPGIYPLLPLRHAMVALAGVGAALALRRWRPGWMASGWGPLTRLAGISYALYVLHYPILASSWFAALPQGVGLAVQLALVLVLAILAEHLLQPFADRMLRRRRDAPALGETA